MPRVLDETRFILVKTLTLLREPLLLALELSLPGGQSVTVEIKGQANIKAGEPMDLGFEGSKFHVFGPDEKVMRHA